MAEDEVGTGGAEDARSTWRRIMMVLVALLGTAVLIALIVTLSSANRERDRALRLQSHSYQVMILARTLSGTVARAEASLGRFVISGNKQVGRVYFDEWLRAGEQIERLDEVTRADGTHSAPIENLRTVYRDRGAQLSETALNTNYGQNDQALSLYYKIGKDASLARMDGLLEQIITLERQQLDERTAAARRTVDEANTIVGVLVGFGIVLVLGGIALGGATLQALAQRTIARADAEIVRARAGELEDAVSAATVELRAANVNLQREAHERAEAEARLHQVQKLDAVGQLTGGIAHDFNNMLAVVVGGLELAQRRLRDGEQAARHIDNAMEGANRAAALTRRLLAFARSEPLLPEAVEPGALIAGMSDLLDRTLGDGITVLARDEGRGDAVWVDRHQLENAILNLAVNARDAMDGQGTLTISNGMVTLGAGDVGNCAAGRYATVSVTDTGCGMTPEIVDRVFEPFFTTKPVGKGTGLGLSQIFGFVRQSGGEIAIRSAPGEGTIVTLYLPRHEAREVIALAPPLRSEELRPALSDTLAILVVEDDPRVLTATMAALTELGHRPVACADPLEAPARLAAMGGADLLVSDVVMPNQSGPEMVAALRRAHPDLAILFVTGHAGDVGESEVFGGHSVLRKPFTIAGLARALDEVMAPRRAATPLAAE